MSEYLDNPAGRLHELLIELHRATPREQNNAAWNAWVGILTPPETPVDSPEAVAAIARLLELPAAVRAAVAALDPDKVDEDEKAELVEDLDKIETGLRLTTQQSHPVKQIFAPFAPSGDVPRSAAVRTLKMCARKLHRLAPEPMTSADDLDRLAESVVELMQEVQDADLSPKTKALLLRHLHLLLQAIHSVRITGIVVLEERMDAFSAALVVRQPEAGEELLQSSVIGRFKAFLEAINLLLRGARGVNALTAEAADLARQNGQLLDHGVQAVDHASRLLG